MKDKERIVSLIRVAISSDNEGEILAALQQVRRFLGKMGATAADVGVYIGTEAKAEPPISAQSRSTHSPYWGYHGRTQKEPFPDGFAESMAAMMEEFKRQRAAAATAGYGRHHNARSGANPQPEKKVETPQTSAYRPPPPPVPKSKPKDGSWYLKPGSLSDACLQELREADLSACEVAIAASAPISFGSRYRDKSTAWVVDNAVDYVAWYLDQPVATMTHKISCEFGSSTFRDLVRAWRIYRYHYPKLPDL